MARVFRVHYVKSRIVILWIVTFWHKQPDTMCQCNLRLHCCMLDSWLFSKYLTVHLKRWQHLCVWKNCYLLKKWLIKKMPLIVKKKMFMFSLSWFMWINCVVQRWILLWDSIWDFSWGFSWHWRQRRILRTGGSFRHRCCNWLSSAVNWSGCVSLNKT